MSELKKRTAINIGFNGIAVLTASAFQFITSIILARLLLPKDYGIVGFALIFVNFMTNFSDFGIASALIQNENADDDLMFTGFAMKAFTGVFAFAAVFCLAPVFRIFNGGEEIIWATRALSFGFLILIPAFLPQVTLTMELRYRELSYPQVAAATASSFCAIALAYAGFGFRSIIAGYLMNSLIIAVGLNLMRPVKPIMRYVKTSARHILKFGSHILVPGIITFLIFNTDNFAIGTFEGAQQLGYYAMAFNLGSVICILLSGIVHQVLFPTFSKFQRDLNAIKMAYLESMKYVAFIAVPFNLFLIVLGREFLYQILGGNSERWLPALATFQVLCGYGVLRALLEPLSNVITGIGKPRLFIRATLLVAMIQMSLLYPALRYAGIKGVAVVVTVSYFAQYFVYAPILKREIDVRRAEVTRAIRPAFLAFLAALPAVIFLKAHFEPSLFLTAAEIITGGAGYLIIYGMLTKWQILKEIKMIMRNH